MHVCLNNCTLHVVLVVGLRCFVSPMWSGTPQYEFLVHCANIVSCKIFAAYYVNNKTDLAMTLVSTAISSRGVLECRHAMQETFVANFVEAGSTGLRPKLCE